MNKIKKISILTLTYNNSHLLGKAISSVNRQIISSKYKVEYLVVDDASSNLNIENVKSKLEDCPFKYRLIVNPQNLGTVKSFNRAILESVGEIIIPLSADDEFYDEYVVSNIIDEFEKSQALILTGIRVPVKDDKELNDLPLIKDRLFFQARTSLLNRIVLKGNIISGSSTYYHKQAFEKLGLFEEHYKLLEDFPFYVKALANNVDIHFFNRKVIRYSTGGISDSATMSPILKDDFIKSYRYIISLDFLGYWQSRFIFYSKILNRNDKRKVSNLLRYPEQYLYSFFLKVKKYSNHIDN
ncbi:hypothetical protein CXF72_14920 [Psychromonas sp. MB-3u-54]|uniref:glycosyltransferase n=1 Tax=Psychromonas sp. MB-3u-54 TaxID=2058319 RepID=UPI000C31CDD2|nr:glycosyltransferase [Psychromonas sp. MB-3u-54]PKH01849.1 hypothetical protein CXF72_14920 [Psychromonas sp. MB-3u-54]